MDKIGKHDPWKFMEIQLMGMGNHTGKCDDLPGNIMNDACGCSRATQVLMDVENPNTRLLLISCSQGILSSSSFSCYPLLRLLVYMYLSQLMRTFTNYLKCIVISS